MNTSRRTSKLGEFGSAIQYGMMVFAAVIVGGTACDKQTSLGPQVISVTESKLLPPELRKQTGVFSNATVACMVGTPDAESAGVFVVNGTNTSGTILRQAVAHLFLLNERTTNSLRISARVGTIQAGAVLHAEFPLRADSAIGSNWQKNQRTFATANERGTYGAVPTTILFISTSDATYEVAGSRSVGFYYPTADGNYQKIERTLLEGDTRLPFEACGVELPKP